MNVFEGLYKFFAKKTDEVTMLSDASNKILNQMEGYDAAKEEMNFKNLGWDTIEKADIAGGVEENRELTEGEIQSFFKALSQVFGEN